MSLEETKQLLRTHRISPNKLLGQNFMVEPSLYPKLCTYAALSCTDVVLDAVVPRDLGSHRALVTRGSGELLERDRDTLE